MQCYIVDVFSDRIFGGNPAAVCVLHDKWLPDRLMQTIAKEHNLSETAFVFVKMARINSLVYANARNRPLWACHARKRLCCFKFYR